MTAETLRRAATLMRERAEACVGTSTPDEEPWYRPAEQAGILTKWHRFADASPVDAAHIASWHPAVALEVASLLMTLADFMDEGEPLPDDLVDAHGVGIARAYLGENESFRPERGAE